MEKKTVVVGMSGGVDSSVAAYLLKEQGYNVIGVTMQLWQGENVDEQNLFTQRICDAASTNPDRLAASGSHSMISDALEYESSCCGLSATEDARRVAMQLDIPYYVLNFREQFKEKVIDYFIKEYKKGNTPNPCIACNRYLKWEAMLNRALEIGADYIATGHYARIIKLSNGRYSIRKSAAEKKDQTYVLFNLSQYQLEHTLMPIGDYNKEDVRNIAKKLGLNVADKSESQDICFIPDHDYVGFIERQTGEKCKQGNFVDNDGNILGIHKGIENYTIGQRKGLNLPADKPYYVSKIIPETNSVVLGDYDSVFTDTIYVHDVNYMAAEKLTEPRKLIGKIRYSHQGAECVVTPMGDNRLKCEFTEKQRAATPGQAAVFYEDNCIYCGGWIEA